MWFTHQPCLVSTFTCNESGRGMPFTVAISSLRLQVSMWGCTGPISPGKHVEIASLPAGGCLSNNTRITAANRNNINYHSRRAAAAVITTALPLASKFSRTPPPATANLKVAAPRPGRAARPGSASLPAVAARALHPAARAVSGAGEGVPEGAAGPLGGRRSGGQELRRRHRGGERRSREGE